MCAYFLLRDSVCFCEALDNSLLRQKYKCKMSYLKRNATCNHSISYGPVRQPCISRSVSRFGGVFFFVLFPQRDSKRPRSTSAKNEVRFKKGRHPEKTFGSSESVLLYQRAGDYRSHRVSRRMKSIKDEKARDAIRLSPQ